MAPKFKPFKPVAEVKPFVPSFGASPIQSGASTPGLSTPGSSASLSSQLSALTLSPISEPFDAIRKSTAIAEVKEAANEISQTLIKEGPKSIKDFELKAQLSALTKAKGSALHREAAAVVLTTIAKAHAAERSPFDAYLVPFLTIPLDMLIDKDNSVKRAAQTAVDSIYNLYPAEAKVSAVLTVLNEYLSGSAKWQSKLAALKLVEKILKDVPADFLESRFLDTIPVLTNMMHDMKPELSKAGQKTLTDFASKLDNQDILPRMDLLVNTLHDPRKVPDCLKALSQVTFVAEVTEPALSLLVPILSRALNLTSISQDSLRQTVIVVENLTRLVHNPQEVKAFIPELKPGIKKVVDTAAQPEVRGMAEKALAVLNEAEAENFTKTRITRAEALAGLSKEQLSDSVVNAYAEQLIAIDVNTREFEKLDAVYKSLFKIQDPSELVNHFKAMFADSAVADSSEEGIEIVNANFSLAYGGRMLLNKTTLRLFKGRRYGLCGRNGAGKSTLMRSIANGKLEGFPDESQLRTCFVEHKLQGSEADMNLVDFIASDKALSHVTKDEVAAALAEVGFDEERRAQNVGALSGGWKMKLELARAMLMKADILLLDEPTNHLDVSNVKWLEDYLVKHTDITSLIVSHDSGFLDAVCTDIIHYETKKLVYYKGNLAEFVKVRPEGKAYYTLTDSNVKMAFPPPGILTGVRSNTRAVARMNDVTFTYPGAPKPSLSHVSCSLSLSSRVAILGPNGAGKSTLIKLLTGELIPSSGKVEKHPNLRIGYIAQHALQHVEQHKEKTPNQYLQWRYANGDDREVHLKQSRIMTAEEREIMEKPVDDGEGYGGRVLEAIIGRQKFKKTFRYEIKWKGYLPRHNSFCTREFLIEHGFNKLVQEFDDHEASREGLGYRQLSPPVIRQHFEEVGLDGEIADHTPLGSLSGGQLVKVVIAGAMWNNPHLLVLDEPTNYLDRDSLGGLAVAIRDWTGGVVMISHNNEFVGALCPEQWVVENGQVVQKGKSAVASDRFEDSANNSGESTPASSRVGSTSNSVANSDAEDSPANIKIKKKKKKLTRNEMKERDARRRARYLEWLQSPKGTPRFPDTDDEEE